MERDAILLFNGRCQSMPLDEYLVGTDDRDDAVTVLKQICESVAHSEIPIILPVLSWICDKRTNAVLCS